MAQHSLGMGLQNWMILALAVCLFSPPLTIAGEVSDGIAAIVNEEVITLSELNGELRDEKIRLRARFQGEEFDQRLLQKEYQALNTLIEQKLQLQEAKSIGITVSDDELEKFLTQLGKTGPTQSESPEKVREQLIIRRVVDFKIRRHIMASPQEIEEYYANHQDRFTGAPHYQLRQILFLSSLENLVDLREQARQVYAQLKNGASFPELARRYSNGPEASRGGELGSMAKTDLLPPIAKRLEAMNPGDLSPPIETDLGIHIILLEDVIEGKKQSFEEVQPQIGKLLIQEKTNTAYQAWITSLKEKAYIEVKL